MAQYPTSAATDTHLYVAVNSKSTTLAGALTSSGGNNGSDIEVIDATGFPSSGFITIDQEAISYTSILSGPPRFSGIVRGADGTTATAHSAGSTVKHNVIAAHHNAPKDEIIALETHLLPGQHTGTATNDNAAAGKVGEYVSNSVGATNFPATGTWGDLTSISLSAGDWDVSVAVGFLLNGATVSSFDMGVSVNSGNSSTGLVVPSTRMQQPPAASASSGQGCALAPNRFSLTATTTIYLKYLSDYSAGTPQASGFLRARRVR